MTERMTVTGAHESTALPQIRRITTADLKDALAKGFEDFKHKPSHIFFLGLVYPIVGLFLAWLAEGYNVLPLVFPLAAGFALLGPFAAIAFYEISRRREYGLDASWYRVFDLIRSPKIVPILALGGILLAIFLLWLIAAQTIYSALFEGPTPATIEGFRSQIIDSREGTRLIVIGNAVGFLFALLIFSISVISFPMIIDRNVSAPVAIGTSLRAVFANPATMGVWAFIIALLLFLGSLPFLLGLAIVLPVLGHASWHLYRRVVAA